MSVPAETGSRPYAFPEVIYVPNLKHWQELGAEHYEEFAEIAGQSSVPLDFRKHALAVYSSLPYWLRRDKARASQETAGHIFGRSFSIDEGIYGLKYAVGIARIKRLEKEGVRIVQNQARHLEHVHAYSSFLLNYEQRLRVGEIPIAEALKGRQLFTEAQEIERFFEALKREQSALSTELTTALQREQLTQANIGALVYMEKWQELARGREDYYLPVRNIVEDFFRT